MGGKGGVVDLDAAGEGYGLGFLCLFGFLRCRCSCCPIYRGHDDWWFLMDGRPEILLVVVASCDGQMVGGWRES